MKKLLALLMAITLILAFSACGKDNSSDNLSSTVAITEFQKPEGYASVLLVTINPKFELYLDANSSVMAINALNDDAQSFKAEIDLSAPALDAVIEKILTAANQKGFVNADKPEISFEVSEVKVAGIDKANILDKATSAANKAADALKLGVTVNTSSQPATDTESQSSSSDTATSSQASTSSKTSTSSNLNSDNSSSKTSSKVIETSSKASTSSKLDESVSEAHTHSFSKATCTESAKCACGKTDGEALGHKWAEATCFQRKTCTVCKKTEGEILPHNYVDGFCSYCKEFESINPKNIKQNVEYIGNFRMSGDTLIASAFMFDSEACVLIDRTFTTTPSDPEQTPVIFNGKKYYSEGGGMEPYKYNLTDKYVEVTQSFYEESPEGTNLRVHLMKDGRLIVKATRFIEYPAGSVYSTDINQVL
ncbi:MAG: hypothetical protein IJ027_02840 [Oscillospiraceae bacterium]|nr:hypothetical protein [Oscillospiraceae bacterium]